MFHEAKNESGADFDTHTPDTYKAVYAVEPVSGHPSYRISRNITVKEPETEMQSESSSEITVDDDSGTGDTEQSDDDSESHRENTVDTKKLNLRCLKCWNRQRQMELICMQWMQEKP